MADETPEQRRLREAQFAKCRALADQLRAQMPPDTGFILFLADHGERGALSCISTIRREDAHRLIHEWLDHEDADHPATGWETAVKFLGEVAAASGFEGDPYPDRVLAHLREISADLPCKKHGIERRRCGCADLPS